MTTVVLTGVAVEIDEAVCVCGSYITRGVDGRWLDDVGHSKSWDGQAHVRAPDRPTAART